MQRCSIYNHMTKSEQKVAQFLKELGIFWSYEKPIYVWDKNERPRVRTPDFFLTQFSIYIEVCGSEYLDYEYRKNVYRENDCDVIFLHLYKDPDKWKNHLMSYLEVITNYRNNKLSEILKKENGVKIDIKPINYFL